MPLRRSHSPPSGLCTCCGPSRRLSQCMTAGGSLAARVAGREGIAGSSLTRGTGSPSSGYPIPKRSTPVIGIERHPSGSRGPTVGKAGAQGLIYGILPQRLAVSDARSALIPPRPISRGTQHTLSEWFGVCKAGRYRSPGVLDHHPECSRAYIGDMTRQQVTFIDDPMTCIQSSHFPSTCACFRRLRLVRARPYGCGDRSSPAASLKVEVSVRAIVP